MNAPFDIGIEHEFFLVRYNQNAPATLFNASKEMEKILGFSINQNDQFAGQLVLAGNSSGGQFVLRTDGTAMELQAFFSWYASHYKADFHGLMFDNLNKIKFLNDYTRSFTPFAEVNKGWTFDSPGNPYGSYKTLRDAYIKQVIASQKKDDPDKPLSFRTAGIHVHFSLADWMGEERQKALNTLIFNRNDYSHTDELIKRFDIIYEELSNQTSFQSQDIKLRSEKYQKKGVYRMKFNTITGNPTLEYRQLASCEGHILNEFIYLCQREGAKYLKEKFQLV